MDDLETRARIFVIRCEEGAQNKLTANRLLEECAALIKELIANRQPDVSRQRVLFNTDGHCPSCGHNRNTSAISSIDNDDGTHYCQKCSAEWREIP